MHMKLLLLMVGLFLAVSVHGALEMAFCEMDKANAGQTVGCTFSAQAGDMIVVTAAKSTNEEMQYQIGAADGGRTGAIIHAAWDGSKNVDVVFWPVLASGSFELTFKAGGAYVTYGVYVLHSPAGGPVKMLASDARYEEAGVGINRLDYGDFDNASGIVIETVSAGDDVIEPAGRTACWPPSSRKRGALWGIFSNRTQLQTEYVLQPGHTKNSRAAGALFHADEVQPVPIGLVGGI